jgi:hypothetical protein
MLEGSTSVQDVSGTTYLAAMMAFAAGQIAETRDLARTSRDAYSGANSGLAAVLAAQASLLLGDVDSARADRTWLFDGRFSGTWIRRWLNVLDAGISAMSGSTGEAAVTFQRLLIEWQEADLRLDEAKTLLIRARLINDAGAPEALENARQIFEERGALLWFERLLAGAGGMEAFVPGAHAGSGESPAVADAAMADRKRGAPATR